MNKSKIKKGILTALAVGLTAILTYLATLLQSFTGQ